MDILLDAIFRAICFPIGWPIMRVITLGKYPAKGAWFSEKPESEWTAGVGLAVLMVAMMAALKQFLIP